jgi:hypothetical protein
MTLSTLTHTTYISLPSLPPHGTELRVYSKEKAHNKSPEETAPPITKSENERNC